MVSLIADNTITTSEFHSDLKSVLFVGVFILVGIGVAIWWLRR